MKIQDKINELTKNITKEFDLLIDSKSDLKNFTRYQKALDDLANLQLYIKQNNLDPNSEISIAQKSATALLK